MWHGLTENSNKWMQCANMYNPSENIAKGLKIAAQAERQLSSTDCCTVDGGAGNGMCRETGDW